MGEKGREGKRKIGEVGQKNNREIYGRAGRERKRMRERWERKEEDEKERERKKKR